MSDPASKTTRRSFLTAELSDEEITAVAASDIDPKHQHPDAMLDDDPDDNWEPVTRIMCDEEAHCFVQAVLNVCRDKGYPGEAGLSIHDWLKERLP